MKAYIVGITLVVVPEDDKEREQLKSHYDSKVGRLWEFYGIEEHDGSLSVQPMCPVGLQDSQIMDHIRFMLEVED